MNQLKTILLLGALSAILVAAGAALGPQWAWGALALALGMNLFAWFFSDRLVLRMSGAREVSREEAPELHRMVDELSARAGIPAPRVHLIDAPHANAFATGRAPPGPRWRSPAGCSRSSPRASTSPTRPGRACPATRSRSPARSRSSTHPPAEERIARLRAMATERPRPGLVRGAMPRRAWDA